MECWTYSGALIFVFVMSSSTWLNITEPSHLAGVLDCKHVDLIKSSAVVTEMQHNMPKVSEVVKTWPFEENPKDWNACYQDLLGRVTGRSMAAEKIGPDDFAELYRLCAVQGHFLQAAIAGTPRAGSGLLPGVGSASCDHELCVCGVF